MLRKMLGKIKYANSNKSRNFTKQSSPTNANNQIEYIPKSIVHIQGKLDESFSDTKDFITRTLTLQNNSKTAILIAYFEGMVDTALLNENILKPIMERQKGAFFDLEFITSQDTINILKEDVLTCSDITEIKDFSQIIIHILSGDVILFIDGTDTALGFSFSEVKTRDISEPLTEAVVRGPREGFTEHLKVNKTMIRICFLYL